MIEGSSVLRYVALGDSYTIGTSVAAGDRWPDQLVGRARRGPSGAGPRWSSSRTSAVNGYTAADRPRAQLPRLAGGARLGFASLLVGVNDVVQGVPEPRSATTSRRSWTRCSARLPARPDPRRRDARLHRDPDGRRVRRPGGAAGGDRRVNAVMAGLCAERGIAFVDGIFAISTRRGRGPLAGRVGRPAPVGRPVPRWVVERIEPVVRGLLARS